MTTSTVSALSEHRRTLLTSTEERQKIGDLTASSSSDVKVFGNALSEDWYQELAFLVAELTDSPHDEFRRGHWYSLDCEPENLVEHTVGYLSQYAQLPHQVVGGEWWLRYEPGNKSHPLHYDFDLHLLEKKVHRLPYKGSVFFFTEHGGPTVVMNQSFRDGSSHPSQATSGVAVVPRPNQYMVFPGDRRHGVLDAAGHGNRITLLVNWWTYRPQGLDELSQQARDALRTGPSASAAGRSADPVMVTPILIGDCE